MNKTLHGTVSVNVGDDAHTLIPSLAAVRAIEARFGGLRAAVVAINELSVDGCAHVIAAGAGLKGDAAEALAESVWEAGVSEVGPQLIPYMAALLNPRAAKASAEGNAKKGPKDTAQ